MYNVYVYCQCYGIVMAVLGLQCLCEQLLFVMYIALGLGEHVSLRPCDNPLVPYQMIMVVGSRDSMRWTSWRTHHCSHVFTTHRELATALNRGLTSHQLYMYIPCLTIVVLSYLLITGELATGTHACVSMHAYHSWMLATEENLVSWWQTWTSIIL